MAISRTKTGFRRPAPLSAGEAVRAFTASSPFDRGRFERGLPLLEARYRVSLAEGLFERSGFLAGSDDARALAINLALRDDSRALIAARGGYGATRLLPHLPLDTIARASKWLVGFSDVTALHAQWARAGLCSLHAPMVCSLADASEAARSALFSILEGGSPPALTGLSTWVGGRAEGHLCGGNLTVLTALVGTPYAPCFDGGVLLLEDVTERPYRLDRMLTTLLQSELLRDVRGIVLGQFSECVPGPDGVTAEDVLRERLTPLGVPIVADASIGHIPENLPVLLGGLVRIEAGTLAYLE